MCAKLIIQANISHVFFRERYRDPAGLDILETAGVVAVHYTRWENTWRE
jgi:deoxycytidylate deaminase